MAKLGVNIDHIATLRQARYRSVKSVHIEPDPIKAAGICLKAGTDSVVMHLREDRRHIHDKDLKKFADSFGRHKLNLEMSIASDIVDAALKIRPAEATLVPEKRKELTTEGGLDVVRFFNKVKIVVAKLRKRKIKVSLFIDPKKNQILAAKKVGADFIELHTGKYSEAKTSKARSRLLKELINATKIAKTIGLGVNAGHGLNYQNVKAIAKIKGIEELNIGHSIISRSIFTGLDSAVREIVRLIR